ncbi:MAG: flavodoxin family protein [Oscillospiraceae bacterium]|nr:flavodoxin family protein [Oscillospiraceae bacterium]
MQYLIISGNPKTDGLCKSVEDEVIRGARDGGAEVTVLNTKDIPRCHVCGAGWGSCRDENRCAFGADGFDDAQALVKAADAICIITPVYWGEITESLKAFIDRFRRCEFDMDGSRGGALAGKKVLLVASPGGSGNGMVSCLDQLDRFCRATGAQVFDYIGVNRWNCEYKREAAYAAAKAMVP